MPDAAAGGKPSRHDKQAAAKPAAGKPKAGGQGGIHDPHAAREAGRYENPIASREAILPLLVDADRPPSADALAEPLPLTEPARFYALPQPLRPLVPDCISEAPRLGTHCVRSFRSPLSPYPLIN